MAMAQSISGSHNSSVARLHETCTHLTCSVQPAYFYVLDVFPTQPNVSKTKAITDKTQNTEMKYTYPTQCKFVTS